MTSMVARCNRCAGAARHDAHGIRRWIRHHQQRLLHALIASCIASRAAAPSRTALNDASACSLFV